MTMLRRKAGRPCIAPSHARRDDKGTPTPRLKLQLEAFVHEYDANGGNGVRAYQSSHPGNHSTVAAATGAYRLLRNPQIAAALEKLKAARFKRLQISGDEALARVGLDATADIRQLFDEKGKLMAPHLWPDSIAQSVKAVREGPFGLSVTLNDSLQARRIILEQTGKLNAPGEASALTLARIIAGDFTEPDEPT